MFESVDEDVVFGENLSAVYDIKIETYEVQNEN